MPICSLCHEEEEVVFTLPPPGWSMEGVTLITECRNPDCPGKKPDRMEFGVEGTGMKVVITPRGIEMHRQGQNGYRGDVILGTEGGCSDWRSERP